MRQLFEDAQFTGMFPGVAGSRVVPGWLRLREPGLVKSGGRQRTDSTHMLAAIRI
jgi:hypothetical protein